MSSLGTRLVTGLIMVSTALTLIWVPALQLGWVLFVAAIAAVGLNEYANILTQKGLAPERAAVVFCGVAVVVAAHFGGHMWTCAALTGAFLLVGFLHVIGREPSIAGLAGDMFGLVYVGWFPAHVVLIHQSGDTGPGLVTVMIAAVALCDVGAYFIGKGFGKHKLAPVISPNKTWEGAIGGFLATIMGMAAIYYVREGLMPDHLPAWPLWAYIAAGALLSTAGQIGDLVESSLKRDAGVKDAGTIFPGHGGVLDRFDGFLFAAPVLYYGLVLFA